MALIIKKIVVGPLETNCYIVSCEYTGHTFVIDPGDNSKTIINYIHRNEFIPKGIILTHGHPDHIGGLKMIKGELGAPVMIHRVDAQMLKLANVDSADRYLVDRELLNLGRETLTVIHTPGHTPGSICILGDNILFSGDTLFKDGVGRTDLPGGSISELEDSLKNRIFILPPETIVYPGHGPETKIAHEISSR